MAQTGYTPILIYSSSTASQSPAAGNLTNSTLGSELAINITDGKLFYKDNANAVQVIGWKTTPTTAGGTGLTSYTAGDLLYYATGTTLSRLAIGTSGQWLGSSGTAPQWNSPAALTKTDDTNVTLTLGGSASTALLNAASLTLGWTGQLAVTRGGTGLASVAQGDILYGSAANTLSALAKNTTATRYLSNTGTSNNPAWAQVDLTNGVTGTLPIANGGTAKTSFTAGQLLYGSFSQSSGLYYDGTNLGLGTSSPTSNTNRTTFTVDNATWGGVLEMAVGGTVHGRWSWSTGGYTAFGTVMNEALQFVANNTTVSTLFPSGGFSIGNTTDPGAKALSVSGTMFLNTNSTGLQTARSMSFLTTGGCTQYVSHSTSDGNGDTYAEYGYNGTKIGSISQSGTTGVNFNTTSDYRLKNVTGPLVGSGEYIDSLEPVVGTWKSDGSVFIGLIAHQAQEVSKTNVATGEKDGEEMQSLAYANPEFIANMIAELKSLRKRVAQIEAKG